MKSVAAVAGLRTNHGADETRPRSIFLSDLLSSSFSWAAVFLLSRKCGHEQLHISQLHPWKVSSFHSNVKVPDKAQDGPGLGQRPPQRPAGGSCDGHQLSGTWVVGWEGRVLVRWNNSCPCTGVQPKTPHHAFHLKNLYHFYV